VTACAIGDAGSSDSKSRIFLIPSSIKTGEIARVLREGYDVALLNDGFQQLLSELKLDFLLIDTHPGVNEETLLSIAVADLFIVILRPDQQDFQGTAVTVELARRLEVQALAVIINKVPPGLDPGLLREQVEAGYGVQVVGMLPLNPEIAHLGSAGIFVNRFPQHPFTTELKRVAKYILQQCQA
jgi:MinD-like ATPase involved in chromosome partitioning or flagellar assembly